MRTAKGKSHEQPSTIVATVTEGNPCSWLPVGAKIMGEFLPFISQRAAVRPGQMVVTLEANGKQEFRPYHESIIHQVIAIIRAVILPANEKKTAPGLTNAHDAKFSRRFGPWVSDGRGMRIKNKKFQMKNTARWASGKNMARGQRR